MKKLRANSIQHEDKKGNTIVLNGSEKRKKPRENENEGGGDLFGAHPPPFGGVPQPFGGEEDAPQPFGGVPQPFGGAPLPIAPSPPRRSPPPGRFRRSPPLMTPPPMTSPPIPLQQMAPSPRGDPLSNSEENSEMDTDYEDSDDDANSDYEDDYKEKRKAMERFGASIDSSEKRPFGYGQGYDKVFAGRGTGPTNLLGAGRTNEGRMPRGDEAPQQVIIGNNSFQRAPKCEEISIDSLEDKLNNIQTDTFSVNRKYSHT